MVLTRVNINRLLYFWLIFFLIYIPFINVAGVVIHLPYIFTFYWTLIFFIAFFKRAAISRIYLKFTVLYWIGGVLAYLVGKYNLGIDKSILFGYFSGSLSLFASYSIVRYFSNKIQIENSKFLIRSIYISGLIHAIIMILAFFITPFRNLLYTIVPLGDKGEGFVETMIRSPGLTTGGGDALSVIQSISLMFGIYYFIEIRKRSTIYRSLAYLLSFIILLLSILLSARTGLILFIIYLILLFLYKLVKGIAKKTIDSTFLSKILFTLVVFSIVVPIGYNYLMNSEYSRFAKRAFELYINYVESGELGTSSTNSLQEMYFVPKETSHLLFGNGNFGRDEELPIIPSDVGYVRMMFGVGIIGAIIMLLPLFYTIGVALKKYRLNKHLTKLTILVIFVILVTNIKVFHYFEFRESFKVLFLLISSITSLKINQNTRSVNIAD